MKLPFFKDNSKAFIDKLTSHIATFLVNTFTVDNCLEEIMSLLEVSVCQSQISRLTYKLMSIVLDNSNRDFRLENIIHDVYTNKSKYFDNKIVEEIEEFKKEINADFGSVLNAISKKTNIDIIQPDIFIMGLVSGLTILNKKYNKLKKVYIQKIKDLYEDK